MVTLEDVKLKASKSKREDIHCDLRRAKYDRWASFRFPSLSSLICISSARILTYAKIAENFHEVTFSRNVLAPRKFTYFGMEEMERREIRNVQRRWNREIVDSLILRTFRTMYLSKNITVRRSLYGSYEYTRANFILSKNLRKRNLCQKYIHICVRVCKKRIQIQRINKRFSRIRKIIISN